MPDHIFLIEPPFLKFDETNTKIAAFDYDWTLVKPKEARTFPKDINDWQWLRPNVPDIIKKYYDNEYSMYIFSNQTKKWKIDMIKDSLTLLNIPIKIIIGFGKYTKLIKPNPELFNEVIPEFDKLASFYCGDAAGRPNDWSDVDIQFAHNININFKNPEDLFPIELVKNEKINPTIIIEKDTQEIVVLVGFAASGKTTFAQNKLSTYVIISGDELKTTDKMIKNAKSYLDKSYSVVFDATNGKLENRKKIIDFAKENKIDIRCMVFDVDIETAMEWNTKRMNETSKKVPKIAFYTYRKYYTEPSVEEGFDEVIHVSF